MPFAKWIRLWLAFLCDYNQTNTIMENLPVYISLSFMFTTALTVFLFYKASGNSRLGLAILLGWLVIQGLVAYSGFYTIISSVPPRFMLLIFPPLLVMAILFMSAKGRQYIDRLDVSKLTILHIVRIPVELVLFWLFIQHTIPELMTFEGRNFDILSGITAPLIYYFGFVKKQLNPTIILFWNFICLALLFNIVIDAILSSPFEFQQFGFEQPNIALMYFPFVWLPCCVVPLVLFSHLVSIRNLIKS